MKIQIRLPATVAKMLAPHIECMAPTTPEQNAIAERARKKSADADAGRAAIVAKLGKFEAPTSPRAGNEAKLGKR